MSGRIAQRGAAAFFLKGRSGPLFAVFRPSTKVPSRGGVLFVPPFAEELNKSRRMLGLQAQRLAAVGFDVLSIDLYGTGDSAGDFEQARWETWIDDVVDAVAWLRAQSPPHIALLGLRLGALLATAVLRRGTEISRLVLWQPVISGETMMTQFLRTRIAADIASATEERVSTATLREQAHRGESIEIAGYMLAPELLKALDALRLESLVCEHSPPIDWLEVVTDPDQGISPAGKRVLDAWRKKSIPLVSAVATGQPFWATAEITTVPALLETTTGAFLSERTR